MLLLLVMVIFIVQVAAMVISGTVIHNTWREYEVKAVDADRCPKKMFDLLKLGNSPSASKAERTVARYLLMRYAFLR